MDQVKLYNMIHLDKTLYTKGSHVPVHFPHPDAVSEKSCCSVKLCLHQCVIQPNIALIFQGKGRVIADFYKQSYKYYVLLF